MMVMVAYSYGPQHQPLSKLREALLEIPMIASEKKVAEFAVPEISLFSFTIWELHALFRSGGIVAEKFQRC